MRCACCLQVGMWGFVKRQASCVVPFVGQRRLRCAPEELDPRSFSYRPRGAPAGIKDAPGSGGRGAIRGEGDAVGVEQNAGELGAGGGERQGGGSDRLRLQAEQSGPFEAYSSAGWEVESEGGEARGVAGRVFRFGLLVVVVKRLLLVGFGLGIVRIGG